MTFSTVTNYYKDWGALAGDAIATHDVSVTITGATAVKSGGFFGANHKSGDSRNLISFIGAFETDGVTPVALPHSINDDTTLLYRFRIDQLRDPIEVYEIFDFVCALDGETPDLHAILLVANTDPVITVSDTQTFSQTDVGSSSTSNLEIGHGSYAQLEVYSCSITGSSAFSLPDDTSMTIMPIPSDNKYIPFTYSYDTLPITYTPTGPGIETATLTILNNNATSTTVALTGTGSQIVIDSKNKAWSTQRIANRMPIWSRAVEDDDSVLQTLINPAGETFDDLYAELVRTRDNYFMSSACLNQQDFLYALNLPRSFAFDYTENGTGSLLYNAPSVSYTVGSLTANAAPLSPNKEHAIEKDSLLPTRITATRIKTSANCVILTETLIDSLGSATITSSSLDGFGSLFIYIDEGDLFGWRNERGRVIVPRVILTGTPRGYREEITEAIIFRTNGIKKSKHDWKEISGVRVEGILGDAATIKLDMGFRRDYISNPLAVVVTPLGEYPLMYAITTPYSIAWSGAVAPESPPAVVQL